MFSRTSTPQVAGTGTVTPRHDQLGENVTWIKDWYTPGQGSGEDFTGVQIKGWYKTNINHKNDPTLKLNASDVLDLASWRYFVEETQPVPKPGTPVPGL